MAHIPKDEAAMAEQLMRRHGNAAVLQASETASALHATGDEEGAARWRRIRDLILGRPLKRAGRA